MSFTLAIVGRPNVGKSTLFNRLAGRKVAIVDNQAGVTRDIQEVVTKLGNIKVRVIDTAGLEEAKADTLQFRMSSLSISALTQADVCIFLVDARIGLTAGDQTFAELVRRKAKKIILVVNKVEGSLANTQSYEFFSLGFGAPLCISAEHGLGIDDLSEEVLHLVRAKANISTHKQDLFFVPNKEKNILEDEFLGNNNPEKQDEIWISVVGRPNSGKSTLINKIIGSDRLLTGPESGITRDSIAVSLDWMGQNFKITDTAGMRKKAKIEARLEKLSVADSIQSLKFSEVIILLLDVSSPFDTQDLKIADFAAKEGRSIVLAVNKWDLETNKTRKLNFLKDKVNVLLPQLMGVPLVVLSGLTGHGLAELHASILQAYKTWNIRISTSKLNSWLTKQITAHPPPSIGGRRIKMRYITQIKSRPPTFVVFASVSRKIPESYKRYLINGLRKDFLLYGTPIRLILRKGSNPFETKK